MFEWIVIIGFIIGFIGAVVVVSLYVRSYQLECEAKLMIEDYRAKLTGSNRFLFDENLMRQVFPEYSNFIVHKVWSRLVTTKAIERDSMDGAWCIK